MALSPASSRSSGGSGSLTVTDGVTPVATVSILDFTAGVTVSDAGSGQANASVTGAAPSFVAVTTKTANYTAAAGGYVPVDPSAGNFNVTLPAAPANGSIVAVEHIGSTGAVTMVAGAGDTIDASGATSTSLTTSRRAFFYCYRSSDKVWFGLTSLTTAVLSAAAGGTEIVVGGTSVAPTFRTGTLDVIATNRPPVAAVAMNAQKITGLANGAGAQDAAAFGQIPTSASSIGGMTTAVYDAATIAQQVLGTTASQTVTNKRLTKRSGTTASSATPTINTDNVDFYSLTAQSAAITSFTTNLTGTPTVGQVLWIAITDNGTARAITWGASFEASTVALPTTTTISTRLDVGFVWNDATSKWRCVAVA